MRSMKNAKGFEWPGGTWGDCRLFGSLDVRAEFGPDRREKGPDAVSIPLNFQFDVTVGKVADRPRDRKARGKTGRRIAEAHALDSSSVVHATSLGRHQARLCYGRRGRLVRPVDRESG